MKRQALFIILVVYVTAHANLVEATEVIANLAEIDIKNCEILTLFYNLLGDSFFGMSPSQVERAAWIRLNDKREYEFFRWQTTLDRASNTWKRVVPENVIALAHTHPRKIDSKPSGPDRLLSAHLGIPIYTISRSGIWRVTPDGTVTQEAAREWYTEIKNRSSVPCK
jgi:hypothetical protein